MPYFNDDCFDAEQTHIAICDRMGVCADCGLPIPDDCFAFCENCQETGGEWEPEEAE